MVKCFAFIVNAIIETTYSGGVTIFGSTYFNQGLLKASSAVHRFVGSSSNILSIKSNAIFGKLKHKMDISCFSAVFF